MRQDARQQGKSAGDPEADAVDRIIGQWRRERPDLDPSAKEITGRIVRLSGIFQAAYREAFAPLGVHDGDYGILVALRRTGAPYALTPSALARERMMTSGGMTAALDRLERKGLVERRPNPGDRRGSLVALTDDGRSVVDAAMAVHTDTEHRLVAAIDAKQRAQLGSLLAKLLTAVDPPS
jgi:DNA-binding MarR family transcriptional regulator